METNNKKTKAAEDSFFLKREQELLRELKQKQAIETEITSIELVTGISDRSLLEELVQNGLNDKNIKAFMLFPMILVAWSDGSVSEEEKQVVVKAVIQDGIAFNSATFIQIQKWLENPPNQKLKNLWRRFIAFQKLSMKEGEIYNLNKKNPRANLRSWRVQWWSPWILEKNFQKRT
jgi:hypothetical protein